MNETVEALGVLGLGPNATAKDIQEAYLKLVKECHPDKFMHDERHRKFAEGKLKAINKAFKFLQGYRPELSEEAKAEVPVAVQAEVKQRVRNNPMSPAKCKSKTNVEYEYDIRRVFVRGVPWNHRIGWLFGMVGGFLIGGALPVQLNMPGTDYGIRMSFCGLLVLAPTYFLGFPTRKATQTASIGNATSPKTSLKQKVD